MAADESSPAELSNTGYERGGELGVRRIDQDLTAIQLQHDVSRFQASLVKQLPALRRILRVVAMRSRLILADPHPDTAGQHRRPRQQSTQGRPSTGIYVTDPAAAISV
jgi:hypothetical protein